ncbi:MAG: PulJ/GspJ family protein [Akkermansiaceae bacterium]
MNVKAKSRPSGFTLIELLVSMSITLVLVGILIYMTQVSMETYNSSSNEVKASRQAKEAIEVLSRDLESLVVRSGADENEWLYIGAETSDLTGPSGREIPNSSHLIFFTAATDRYNGDIGSSSDNGGDISAVSYRLVYRDQISDTDDEEHAVFSLYRHLADPDEAFDILALEDLESGSSSVFSESEDLSAENFLVENIYEFTVTFMVEYTDNEDTEVERVILAHNTSDGYTEFRLKSNSIVTSPSNELIESGSVIGAEISITVLTDKGVTLAKKSGILQDDLLKKHSYQYTKKIITPR